MAAYTAAPPKGGLDTCYDFAGAFFVVPPRVELVLEWGNVLELDRSGVLFASPPVLFHDCLAFAPNSDDRMPGILGNVQQLTMEVLYDVAGGAVGFRRGAC
ncbi:aspartyl protease AED1-like [Panicum virgatum]|uniref:aspartyl protease AED1-like n=1 Tax=Panicum virgatum TaxID=38727 RepID=UPI0019D5BDE5|nr:aspartyl protease AED1-like [Panicum virgatum]